MNLLKLTDLGDLKWVYFIACKFYFNKTYKYYAKVKGGKEEEERTEARVAPLKSHCLGPQFLVHYLQAE